MQLFGGQQEAPVNTVRPQHPPKLFKRNPAIYFSKVDEVFGMLPGFLENLLESAGTAATKTAVGIIQLWFHYFRGILAYTRLERLSKEMS